MGILEQGKVIILELTVVIVWTSIFITYKKGIIKAVPMTEMKNRLDLESESDCFYISAVFSFCLGNQHV